MITTHQAQTFAEEWIAAWNSQDLEQILSHYEDGFSMSSPVIEKVMGIASGQLIGKEQVGAYWAKALATSPNLHFTLEKVYSGSNGVAIHYQGVRGLVMEVFEFGASGKVAKASAHYAATPLKTTL